MLLSKAVIGSRAFSNGNASRKRNVDDFKQTPILQGVVEEIKNYAAISLPMNPVSFCARNKIIASAEIVNNSADHLHWQRKENGRSDRI
jgi:hypothetical protein